MALATVSISDINTHYSTTLLSHMGEISAGPWLAFVISLDAFLVLSGAVLTSFVGVSGLLERMTLDRVLPQLFLKKNRRHSSYRIIILFFLLCVSVLLITKGNVGTLAGVYTISFLSVMVLFGLGNILLKIKRAQLPRPEKSNWGSVHLAILMTLLALYGNIIIEPRNPDDPKNFTVFLEYFIPAILGVFFMLKRVIILNTILQVTRYFLNNIQNRFYILIKYLNGHLNAINSQQFVYFAKRDNISVLNKVILYIKNNEHTKRVKLVHVSAENSSNEKQSIENFEKIVKLLDEEYPEIDLECVIEKGEFGPKLIHSLSHKWNIPINFMFIASPGNKFPYKVKDLGGVRLIV